MKTAIALCAGHDFIQVEYIGNVMDAIERTITPRLKEKTPRNQKYLDWLKTQRCAICDRPKYANRDIVAAHQSVSGRGTSIKGSDFEALPLCTFCHDEEGQYGVETTWRGIDRKLMIIKHLTKYIQLMRY